MNDLRTAPHNAERMEREATRVRVFTPSGIVEGDYHHPPGVRLSDSLRNAAQSERYMLLTDVTIRGVEGADVASDVRSAAFILISTQHASVIVPLEDSE